MQKSNARKLLTRLAVFALCGLLLGLGSEHPRCKPVFLVDAPAGLNQLVSHSGRTLGYFVNTDDVFYYRGNAETFAQFLKQYAAVSPIAGHRLTIHEGSCWAKLPWSSEIEPCDWMLEMGRFSWRWYGGRSFYGDSRNPWPPDEAPEFIAEVHLWLESNVNLIPLEIPLLINISYSTLLDP